MSKEQQLKDEDGRLEDEERKLTNDQHRGAQALGILNHPLVAEAFTALETGAFERWTATAAADAEIRETLFKQYQAAQQFRRFFEQTMEDGKIAEKYLPGVRDRRRAIADVLRGFLPRRRSAA